MEQRTEGYRDVLEDLAKSRGLVGAEDLAKQIVEADPDYTVRGVLEGTPAVSGRSSTLSSIPRQPRRRGRAWSGRWWTNRGPRGQRGCVPYRAASVRGYRARSAASCTGGPSTPKLMRRLGISP